MLTNGTSLQWILFCETYLKVVSLTYKFNGSLPGCIGIFLKVVLNIEINTSFKNEMQQRVPSYCFFSKPRVPRAYWCLKTLLLINAISKKSGTSTSIYDEMLICFSHNGSSSNINIRAALIHVIGDFLQSLGVLLSSIVIKVTQHILFTN
jgi:hypothetical protein